MGDRSFGSALPVQVKQEVRTIAYGGGGHGFHSSTIDFHNDAGFLQGFQSLVNSLGLHLAQTAEEGFGLTDGERGHWVLGQ